MINGGALCAALAVTEGASDPVGLIVAKPVQNADAVPTGFRFNGLYAAHRCAVQARY